jgi:hypothetical protein
MCRRVIRISDFLPAGFNSTHLLADDASSTSTSGRPACPPLCADARAVGNVGRFVRPAGPGEVANLVLQVILH